MSTDDDFDDGWESPGDDPSPEERARISGNSEQRIAEFRRRAEEAAAAHTAEPSPSFDPLKVERYLNHSSLLGHIRGYEDVVFTIENDAAAVQMITSNTYWFEDPQMTAFSMGMVYALESSAADDAQETRVDLSLGRYDTVTISTGNAALPGPVVKRVLALSFTGNSYRTGHWGLVRVDNELRVITVWEATKRVVQLDASSAFARHATAIIQQMGWGSWGNTNYRTTRLGNRSCEQMEGQSQRL